MAYRGGKGKQGAKELPVWSKKESMVGLGNIVQASGLKPEEYVPHSTRLGAATRQAANGTVSKGTSEHREVEIDLFLEVREEKYE